MSSIEATGVEEASTSTTSTEQMLGALWSEVLDISIPAPDADFFDLGGDSMTMVMMEYRIMEEFSIPLPTGAILQARTLRELSAFVDERVGDNLVR